jgi:tetratricopeptide (TPR) repeat protein
VAALALLGADTETEAAEIVQRVPELRDAPAERVAAVVSWAAGLYPGGSGVAPLIRPALIGEWFVVSELTADPDLARSVRAGMSQEQAARALGFLARAADHLETASGLFEEFAGGDLNRLVLAAVLAARTGEAGRRLLDPAIAAQIAAADDWALEQLTGLQETVPSYLLLHTHATIAQLIVTARRALAAEDPAHQPALANALDDLGVWLGRVGRYREALEAGEEAIALYRPLAADNPAHQPDLADALVNLGAGLDQVGRSAEALAARTEAVQVYRDLAAADPGLYRDVYQQRLRALRQELDQKGMHDKAMTLGLTEPN